MAKKSVDLFQLLQKRRSRGSFKVAPEPDTREPFDPVGVVADWFRGLTKGTPRKRKPKKKALSAGQRAAGILVSGPTLAGLAFGSLLVGFLLGQGLGADAPNVFCRRHDAGQVRKIGDVKFFGVHFIILLKSGALTAVTFAIQVTYRYSRIVPAG